MGVSGCGKSTVAHELVARLGWDFAEGDDFHSPANIEKMSHGHPLDDADRWPWLERIAAWIGEHIHADRPGIVTCSALKRAYRDVLRDGGTPACEGIAGEGGPVVFVHLSGSRELIAKRLADRHGHYMPAELLDSQFADLQPPGPDERSLTVDITPPPDEQAATIVRELGLSR
jgi:carbohydrate kinase (thermoresistant glucokinase family)